LTRHKTQLLTYLKWGRIAQSVQHWTVKPGIILKWVQFSGAARVSLPESTFSFSADSLPVFKKPLCAYRFSKSACTLKSQTLAAIPLLRYMRKLHILIGINEVVKKKKEKKRRKHLLHIII